MNDASNPIATAAASAAHADSATPARALPFERLPLSGGFARLPESTFHTRLAPTPLPAPYLVAGSPSAAALIGLDPAEFARPEFAAAFAGSAPLPGAEPLAAVYAGHQFGVWAGRLGDGRALLLGEVAAPGGARWELQLKGAGRTPYSRGADGRAVLRSSIREFLCSEAMAALGIPTTRALCVVGSDAPVVRETIETAAVVTRMSPSFVRFGSFEHFAHTGQHPALAQLADWVIERDFPGIARAHPAGDAERYAAWLTEVAARTARLIAQWQAVGFCHGVMNTDNMSILGLTIDYGPFGFLDAADLGHVCNHSDTGGRYAYAQQPAVGEWNCYALAEALLPLIGARERAEQALAAYRPAFAEEFARRMRAKLGLVESDSPDEPLLDGLFQLLHAQRPDFTLFFRNLAKLPAVRSDDPAPDAPVRDLCVDRDAFDAWARQWRARLAREGRDDAERAAAMNRVNPKYVLRNHLAELAIRAARGDHGERDFSEVARLLEVLSRPFDEQPEHEQRYAAPPPDWASALEISCSS